jgi:tripartite-type tricarboxylate transporter receptor subunit TctC
LHPFFRTEHPVYGKIDGSSNREPQSHDPTRKERPMITKRRFLTAACAGVFASVAPGTGQMARAEGWPAKSIRLIESFPAGVARDARTRVIAERLSAALGQPVYVENRPGAGGRIGAQAAVNAPPDGYTFSMLGISDIISKHLYDLPYDVERDLVPVSMVETLPVVLIVSPSLPVKNLGELIGRAKSRPGEMTYGSSGAGSFFHVNALQFSNVTNTDLKHVPYGQGSLMSDLIGGHIDMVFDAVPVYLESLKAGKLRALALTGERRALAMPDVPTFAESGVPTYDPFALYGIAAPKGTPPAIITKMQEAVSQIMHEPNLHRQWLSEGGNPVGSTSAEFAARLRNESQRWSNIVRTNHLRVE